MTGEIFVCIRCSYPYELDKDCGTNTCAGCNDDLKELAINQKWNKRVIKVLTHYQKLALLFYNYICAIQWQPSFVSGTEYCVCCRRDRTQTGVHGDCNLQDMIDQYSNDMRGVSTT